MKRYNVLNNSLGWFCFLVAAVTYLLTLEPTASFWDCPEFILQGFKLEVGHPPGNPIFMLTARFFANFAGGDVTMVAWWVNAMSGLLSAGTILLLFWTITHLVRRLVVKDDAEEISWAKMIVIFGSGICGALMYAWSDTFWFSAVEGEVYAFSSFCTALVFWLILKWESRSDRPDSDKYLILIAYVIGISIAVHLLNLLCIPAIVLVVYYKKAKQSTLKGSIISLLISFVIVGLILYGLVPGFVNVAQKFELLCVNHLGMSFNSGTLLYAVLTLASFAWTIWNLYHYQRVNPLVLKLSFVISILLSGILFIGDGLAIGIVLLMALIAYLTWAKKLPIRIMTLTAISILVIFIGYSSYALLLIRSSAHTPMNQNSPDNVFALASYLNREQYGDRPLIYGEDLTFVEESSVDENGERHTRLVGDGGYLRDTNGRLIMDEGPTQYAREVKSQPSDPDHYYDLGPSERPRIASEAKTLFPRMYDSGKVPSYSSWIGGLEGKEVEMPVYVNDFGDPVQTEIKRKATLGENLRYFFTYQLNHMYWRYFMWNFAGRQNDIQGQGEPTHGNWISGVPIIDNLRLGDQSLLPDELGKDNKGHNVFFMLPLIMGLIGLIWQATCSKRGIEQFWVIFFLFFMTGIAIVLYLNQVPDQPRERDYAFAGSFYAYAIWVGMGVAGLWHILRRTLVHTKDDTAEVNSYEEPRAAKRTLVAAAVAAIVGVIVPLQVVSQTWDDHDRSGRYTAHDFGMNYLNSLDDNAIIFTYGDNDTFPLWYAQEVEGVRTDVKVVNLSYFTTDWYINQLRRQTYEAPGIDLIASPQVYAYNKSPYWYFPGRPSQGYVSATQAFENAYSPDSYIDGVGYVFRDTKIVIPANADAAVASGRVPANRAGELSDMYLDLTPSGHGGMYINNVMALDLINQSAVNGWKRPVYFATTVPSSNYFGLEPYFSQTGMAYEVLPTGSSDINTDKMYRNITQRWRWGGLDKVSSGRDIYLDETVRRMTTSTRSALFDLVGALANQAIMTINDSANFGEDGHLNSEAEAYVADRMARVDTILQLQREKVSENIMPFTLSESLGLIETYGKLDAIANIVKPEDKDRTYVDAGLALLDKEVDKYGQYVRYYQSLSPLHYSLLSDVDKGKEYFFLEYLCEYGRFGGSVATKFDKLSKQGVNFSKAVAKRYGSAAADVFNRLGGNGEALDKLLYMLGLCENKADTFHYMLKQVGGDPEALYTLLMEHENQMAGYDSEDAGAETPDATEKQFADTTKG